MLSAAPCAAVPRVSLLSAAGATGAGVRQQAHWQARIHTVLYTLYILYTVLYIILNYCFQHNSACQLAVVTFVMADMTWQWDALVITFHSLDYQPYLCCASECDYALPSNGSIRVILGLYWSYIGFILGL